MALPDNKLAKEKVEEVKMNRDYAILSGTSQGKLLVSFKRKPEYRHVTLKIADEFGFNLEHILGAEIQMEPIRTLELKHVEYPQEFRVFCCKERYSELGGFE